MYLYSRRAAFAGDIVELARKHSDCIFCALQMQPRLPRIGKTAG